MEKRLINTLQECVGAKMLTGCVCADSQGLCVAAHGDLTERAVGDITQLHQLASKLQPGNQKPIVCLEYPKCKVTISQIDQLIIAKKSDASPLPAFTHSSFA